MSLHRRAAKRDQNEPAIIQTLRAHGCVVWPLSGKGITDLLVFYRRRIGVKSMDSMRHTFIADVKGPKEKATPAQVEKWTALTNLGFAVFILRSPEDAVAMLNNALQPWEPEVSANMMIPIRRVSKKDVQEMFPPKRGDAAKARNVGRARLHRDACRMNGCEAGELCGTSAVPAYTPPRSTPVDAAKEAEETFAPSFRPPPYHLEHCAANHGADCTCGGST